jgi:hypothetical protein
MGAPRDKVDKGPLTKAARRGRVDWGEPVKVEPVPEAFPAAVRSIRGRATHDLTATA